MIKTAVIFLAFVLIGCSGRADLPSRKLSRIRRIKDSLGVVSLPIKMNFKNGNLKRYYLKLGGIDSVFQKDFATHGGTFVTGLLSDTLDFYAMLCVNETGSYPDLLTFDLSGNKIDSFRLLEHTCGLYEGDVVSCEEYVSIAQGLELTQYFKMIVLSKGQNASPDTVIQSGKRIGRINRSGKIELGEFKPG